MLFLFPQGTEKINFQKLKSKTDSVPKFGIFTKTQQLGSLKQLANHTHFLNRKRKSELLPECGEWVVQSCLEALFILMNTIPSLVSFAKVQGKGWSLNFTTYPFFLEL